MGMFGKEMLQWTSLELQMSPNNLWVLSLSILWAMKGSYKDIDKTGQFLQSQKNLWGQMNFKVRKSF